MLPGWKPYYLVMIAALIGGVITAFYFHTWWYGLAFFFGFAFLGNIVAAAFTGDTTPDNDDDMFDQYW